MHLDVAAGVLDHLHLQLIHRRFPGTTAPAGAESCLFGGFWPCKEGHLLAARVPGRTGWVTINACRTHPKHKSPIRLAIPVQYCLPIIVFKHGFYLLISTLCFTQIALLYTYNRISSRQMLSDSCVQT